MSAIARAGIAAAAIVAPLYAVPAIALDIAFGLGYEYQYSDNIRLAPTAPVVESLHIGRLTLGLAERSSAISLRGGANIEHRDYVNDTFEDGVYGSVHAAANWVVVPQRLNWVVEDYFSQTLIDARTVDTPANRQNSNVLSTGPDFIFRINPLNTLELSGRLSNYYYEVTAANNNRLQGDLRWIYRLTPRTDVSLNYQTVTVHFINSANVNFVRDELFVRGRTRPSRSEYTADLGTSIVYVGSGDPLAGALLRFGWRRELNPRTNIMASAGMEYSDHDRDYLGDAGATGGGTTGDAVGIGGFYYGRRFGLGYTHAGAYGSDTLRVFWRTLDYETGAFDQTLYGAEAELGFDRGPLLTPYLFGGYQKTEFTDTAIADVDSYGGLRLRYRLRSRFIVALEGRHTVRDSNDTVRNYEENRGLVTLAFNRDTSTAGR